MKSEGKLLQDASNADCAYCCQRWPIEQPVREREEGSGGGGGGRQNSSLVVCWARCPA